MTPIRRTRLARQRTRLALLIALAGSIASSRFVTAAKALPGRDQLPAATQGDDDARPTFVVNEIDPQQKTQPRTQRRTRRDLRILVYGDMRFTDSRNTTDTTPGVRAWLAAKVADEKPDALLITGDIPFHGGDPQDWEQFQKETARWQQQGLRVYPTVGNHEMIPDAVSGYRNYFAAFPQLKGAHIYSVLLGNVYILSLNSTEPMWPAGAQADWLRAQLDHLPPQVDFVFFLVHVPMIADAQSAVVAHVPSPEMVSLRTYLEQRAPGMHAKFIVASGHIHNYERFEHKGITHVTSGGGGAKPYPIFLLGDEDLYREDTASPNFNYVIFTIHGSHAEGKMYRVADPSAAEPVVTVRDTFFVDAARHLPKTPKK